jgi:hypothetical protein
VYASTLSIFNMFRSMGFVSMFLITLFLCGSFCKTTFHHPFLCSHGKINLFYMQGESTLGWLSFGGLESLFKILS